jgi:hypothetical protein
LLEIRSERGERRDEAVVILERSEKSVTLTLLLRYSYTRIVAIYWIAWEKMKWKGFLQANSFTKTNNRRVRLPVTENGLSGLLLNKPCYLVTGVI